jgi:hypothetical protein
MQTAANETFFQTISNESFDRTYRLITFLNSSAYDYNFGTYLTVRNIFTWLSLLTALIGLVGNLLSFIVLINPKMRTTTNIFLANLCISSFIALICLLINSIFYDITFYNGPDFCFNVIIYLYRFVYPIANTFQMACISLTVAVSFNQFLCVYFSRVRSYSRVSAKAEHSKTVRVVILIYAMSAVYCIPYWLKFKYDPQLGLQKTELGKNKYFNQIVHFWLYLPIVYIIPFSILIVTNAYLLTKLLIAKQRRKSLGVMASAYNSTMDTNQLSQIEIRQSISKFVSSKRKKSSLRSASLTIKKIKAPSGIVTTSNRKVMFDDARNNNNNNNNNDDSVSSNNSASFRLNTQSMSLKRERSSCPQVTMTSSSNKLGRTKITAMLVVVVFFFFICQVSREITLYL